MVGKTGRPALGPFEKPHSRGSVARAELTAVKLRHDVVDVENDFGAGQLGVPGGKDQEIRHVMDVQQVVRDPRVLARNPDRGREQESQYWKEERQTSLLVFAEPRLHPHETDL